MLDLEDAPTGQSPHDLTSVLPTGHELRPMSSRGAGIDPRAVAECRRRLWSALQGHAPVDLPPVPTAPESQESVLFGLFAPGATEPLGCVHVDHSGRPGAAAHVSWWLVDALAGTEVDALFDDAVRERVTRVWSPEPVEFLGRDARWQDWFTAPVVPHPALRRPGARNTVQDPGPDTDAPASWWAAAETAAGQDTASRARRLAARRRWDRRAEMATRRAARASSTLC